VQKLLKSQTSAKHSAIVKNTEDTANDEKHRKTRPPCFYDFGLSLLIIYAWM